MNWFQSVDVRVYFTLSYFCLNCAKVNHDISLHRKSTESFMLYSETDKNLDKRTERL